MNLEESRKAREKSAIILNGTTPRARQHAASILIRAAELRREEPEPWLIAVAEGRLPA